MAGTRGNPIIAVHGGCGMRNPRADRLEWIECALKVGYGMLCSGRSALDAVQKAIQVLELSGIFNAGIGAVRQKDGQRRLDAALMEGRGLRAGAVAGVKGWVTPINLARRVMDVTPHVLIHGEFALSLLPAARALKQNRSGDRRTPYRRNGAGRDMDTVGAIAMDGRGDLAAGTSTGGAPPMLAGRIGDVPLVGCGLYADNNSGAVSATGNGEAIMRAVLAKDICERMSRGASPSTATKTALRRMRERVGGVAGATEGIPSTAILQQRARQKAVAGAIVMDWRGRIALVHHRYMTGGVLGRNRKLTVGKKFVVIR